MDEHNHLWRLAQWMALQPMWFRQHGASIDVWPGHLMELDIVVSRLDGFLHEHDLIAFEAFRMERGPGASVLLTVRLHEQDRTQELCEELESIVEWSVGMSRLVCGVCGERLGSVIEMKLLENAPKFAPVSKSSSGGFMQSENPWDRGTFKPKEEVLQDGWMRGEVERVLDDAMAKFPWLARHRRGLRVAPGHVFLLSDYAKLCEEVMTPAQLLLLEGFYFNSTRPSGPRAMVDPAGLTLSESQSMALMKHDGWAHSTMGMTCLMCAKPSVWNNRCALHQEAAGLFKGDRLEVRATPGLLKDLAEMLEESQLKHLTFERSEAHETKPQEQAQTPRREHNASPSIAPDQAISSPKDSRPKVCLMDAIGVLNKIVQYSKERQNGWAEPMAKAIDLNDERPLGVLPVDWQATMDRFERDFPNMRELSEVLRDHFALSALGDMRVKWPNVLLVGRPGIGKTEAARFLANAFGLPFETIDMASAQSGSALNGSEAYWSNAKPGRLFELLALGEVANPVVVLDELDKAKGDHRHDPLAGLYTLLEPRSAKEFKDLCVGLPMDASHVNWIATANDARGIPYPLLSRMTVLDVKAPSIDQMRTIAQNVHVRTLAEAPWGQHFETELSEDVLDVLSLSEPRALVKRLQQALGAAARDGRRAVAVRDIPRGDSRAVGFGFAAQPRGNTGPGR